MAEIQSSDGLGIRKGLASHATLIFPNSIPFLQLFCTKTTDQHFQDYPMGTLFHERGLH